MPYLRLRDERDQRRLEFEQAEVIIGRDPASTLPIEGSGSEVVSARHVRLTFVNGAWTISDAGSRNGTFLGKTRLASGGPVPLALGAVIGLGERGPRFVVEAAGARRVPTTVAETPATRVARPSAATEPMDQYELESAPPEAAAGGGGEAAVPRAAAPAPKAGPTAPRGAAAAKPAEHMIVLHGLRDDQHFELPQGRIRIGRGTECELRPVEAGDTSVSRVHCEIVWKGARAILRDAGSRNGTLVDGSPLRGEHPLTVGETIRLGAAGPELIVEKLAPAGAEPAPPAASSPSATPAPPAAEPPRRSFAGKGRTVFFKEVIQQAEEKSRSRLRWVIWSFVALLVVTVGGLYLYSERRVQATESELAQQRAALNAQRATADSVRNAALGDYQRLQQALDSARAGSAPAAVVESLRTALTSAQNRTTALEAALERAQSSMRKQLAAGDSLRRAAENDLQRLRSQLAAQSSGASASSAELDSLRKAVQAAEERANHVEAGLRAVRGVDLAHIAQVNQGAVGLVSTYAGKDIWDGSGFVITPDGYLITNRHVVQPEGHTADSVFVTMADHRTMSRADIIDISEAPGPDLAVLRIRKYSGPHIEHVDWAGTDVRQGEPAALIGFPEGVAAALDATRTVRTSMSGGYFSKVTPELIQFDGFTVTGSSGSPVFNADGEVVSVHAEGLRAAAGLGFSIPVRLVLPLLPADVRKEVGR